ncbi:MAG: SET domain-containing protein-lysine N-methyltransferase, partial [Paracoccaceae bacterium]
HEDLKKGQLSGATTRARPAVSKTSVEAMLPHVQEFMDRYSYEDPYNPDNVVLDADEGRFMNHSDTPNLDFSGKDFGYALWDIPAGTELTCNYAEFVTGALMQPPRHRVGPVANGHAAA